MGFKYVMFQRGDRRFPFIFPDTFVHADVAEMVAGLNRQMELGEARPVSAGSIQLDDVSCSGASSTLKVKSLEEIDDKIINVFDYFHGLNFPADDGPEQA